MFYTKQIFKLANEFASELHEEEQQSSLRCVVDGEIIPEEDRYTLLSNPICGKHKKELHQQALDKVKAEGTKLVACDDCNGEGRKMFGGVGHYPCRTCKGEGFRLLSGRDLLHHFTHEMVKEIISNKNI